MVYPAYLDPLSQDTNELLYHIKEIWEVGEERGEISFPDTFYQKDILQMSFSCKGYSPSI